MKLNAAGLKFIADHEGMVLGLYNDPAGHCTVGIGRLLHYGPCDGRASEAPYKNGITETQALAMLAEDAKRFEDAVNALAVNLNQNQFNALVSFAFNLGQNIFAGSNLLAHLRSGQYQHVPDDMRQYVRASGQILPGLVRRRDDEAKLFMTPAPEPEEEDDVDKTLRAQAAVAKLFFRACADVGEAGAVSKEIGGQILWIINYRNPDRAEVFAPDRKRVWLLMYAAAQALAGEGIGQNEQRMIRSLVS